VGRHPVLLHERLGEPATFAFINRGVLLTIADSPVLDALQHLAAGGSRILSCGTCLDYFAVRDRLAVGEVGSIPVLQELMIAADRVITL
ncbi:MAG: DsrE family protein, partial [Actinobacteria bacterium]|nr:DsrE family protein [Actinomycetota bacterium]